MARCGPTAPAVDRAKKALIQEHPKPLLITGVSSGFRQNVTLRDKEGLSAHLVSF